MTNFKFSRRWLLAALLALGLAMPAIGLAGKGGGGGGGTTPPQLPPVRYRIAFPAMPANATGGLFVDNINDLGQVVGWYSAEDGQRAFIYDATKNGGSVIDLNTVVQGGLPEGWRLRSAVSINDHMVIVGIMELTGSSPVQVRPIAIDLGTETPVVDLLPDVGVDFSYGRWINNNGDILGVYQTENGSFAWFFNPDLYNGDAQVRAERNGQPQNMTQDVPQDLSALGSRAQQFHLNNAAPAQIAGVNDNGIAFRYTTGDNPVWQTFPELNLYVSSLGGLNDAGTFCGLLYVPRDGKNKDYTAPFRYTAALNELPPFSQFQFQQPRGINGAGDVIFYDQIYRDDWAKDYGRPYVPVDDLVVGTDADLATWFSGTSVDMFVLNNRAGASNSGQIAGRLGGVAPYPILFILTPEPEIAL